MLNVFLLMIYHYYRQTNSLNFCAIPISVLFTSGNSSFGTRKWFFTSENNFLVCPKQIIRRKKDIGNMQKFELEVYHFKYVSFLGKKILPKQSKWSRNVIKHLIYRIQVYLRRPHKYSKITKLLYDFSSNFWNPDLYFCWLHESNQFTFQ